MAQKKWLGEEFGRQPKPGRIVNRNELAALFNVVPSSVNKYQDLGMPVLRKGRRGVPDQFDSADCLWWRVEYLKQRALGTLGLDPSLPLSATGRKALANAGIAEMKVKAALESVVSVDDAAETFNARLTTIRERIDSVAPKVAEAVSRERDPRRCETIIRQAINEVRKQIVDAGEGERGRS